MRRLLIIFLIIIATPTAYTQTSPSTLIGEWEVLSVSFDGLYLNAKTDSIYVSKELKKEISDSLELNNVIEKTNMYSKMGFIFRENGNYTQIVGSSIRMDGTYSINSTEDKINFVLNPESTFEMNYKMIKEQLHLTLTKHNESVEFVLNKIDQ